MIAGFQFIKKGNMFRYDIKNSLIIVSYFIYDSIFITGVNLVSDSWKVLIITGWGVYVCQIWNMCCEIMWFKSKSQEKYRAYHIEELSHALESVCDSEDSYIKIEEN